MALSKEVRHLDSAWKTRARWPKRLESIEIDGIRGWTGQRLDIDHAMVAIVGENGSGKSTILQAIASVYRSKNGRYASDFFPETAWEQLANASIKYNVRDGDQSYQGSVRKPSTRWRGNRDRRERPVVYIDLKRMQPVADRVGYAKIAKPAFKETASQYFDEARLARLSAITGRDYATARFSLTDADKKRTVPVLKVGDNEYSGFHQGAGETVLAELLALEVPKYAMVLIDEVETSLHPRAQRRLIRDLATIARTFELQIVLSTHSSYVLDELPLEARVYVMNTTSGRRLVTGVSPYFAMTRMDEETHPECDIYVEDDSAQGMLTEILFRESGDLVRACKIIPFGAASVGRALGQMVAERRFPRPSLVFLDGDQEAATGCEILPGGDAPERVVFEGLQSVGWKSVAARVGRGHSDVADACVVAMTLTDHHDWIASAADRLIVGGIILWQAMCAAWVEHCLPAQSRAETASLIRDALLKNDRGYGGMADAPDLESGGQTAVRVGSTPTARIEAAPAGLFDSDIESPA